MDQVDLLRRFDVVFRTVLVIASITISVFITFYKEVMPSYAIIYTVIFFMVPIVIWAFSTLRGGADECVIKIFAWWTLMSAFILLLIRVISSSFVILPFLTTFCLAVALILTWPLFGYFRPAIQDHEQHAKKAFKMGLLVAFIADIAYASTILVLSFLR